MASPRRTPSGRCSLTRRATSSGVVAVVALLVVVLGAAPAGAQPPPPPPGTAAEAAAQLQQVQHEAEALTEQWHAAKDALAARRAEVDALRAAVEPARVAVEAAKAEQETYQRQVDAVAMSTYESGTLDQFNALLASGSPQEFLDQMSALETLTAEYRVALTELSAVVDRTAAAQAEVDAATARAQAAADEAAKAEQDLTVRKREAEVRIDDAERLLQRLGPQERRARNGPGESGPTGPVAGSGAGVAALNAAITKLGRPYQWGSEGPGTFDCSGLTSWAFKQAGVTLPRSSSQQARIGRSVAWNEMQPGDLVFYYRPVSHVGIYVGNGKMINAPQTGDVVKYATVSRDAFSGARRV